MDMLGVPPAAQRDENSVEMMSVWIAEEGLHCSLRFGVWDDKEENATWGMMIADVIRHIANATQQQKGKPFGDTIEEILYSMNAELEDNTSDIGGEKSVGHN